MSSSSSSGAVNNDMYEKGRLGAALLSICCTCEKWLFGGRLEEGNCNWVLVGGVGELSCICLLGGLLEEAVK